MPSAHFDSFKTILNINKLICNLTVHRHYFDSENSSNSEPDPSLDENDSSSLSFREHCAIVDMENWMFEQQGLADPGDSWRVPF